MKVTNLVKSSSLFFKIMTNQSSKRYSFYTFMLHFLGLCLDNFKSVPFSKQKFKHFLVLDFEANCENGKKIEPQEIIEFPCLLVDAQNFQVVDTFHKYIKVIDFFAFQFLDTGTSKPFSLILTSSKVKY